MNFKRNDGVVVYNGPHVGSRGFISSLRNFGEESNDEDTEWDRIVLQASMSLADNFNDYDLDPEIMGLWKTYNREMTPHITIGFDKLGFFRRNS